MTILKTQTVALNIIHIWIIFNVTATANTYAKGDSDYELQYNGKNVNGVDTTTTYKYIKNVDCTSKKTNSASAITLDHSNGRKLTLSG